MNIMRKLIGKVCKLKPYILSCDAIYFLFPVVTFDRIDTFTDRIYHF